MFTRGKGVKKMRRREGGKRRKWGRRKWENGVGEGELRRNKK
jgi:hypothetical protein